MAKKHKMQTTKKITAYKCGKCGETGHNARKCPKSAKATKKKASQAPKPKTKPKVKHKAKPKVKPVAKPPVADTSEKLDEAFDLEASGVDPTADTADAPSDVDPTVVPSGSKLNTPKRKRKRTKAEIAFWNVSSKKLAPDAIAEASELNLQIPRISTGNFSLDAALGGGWPQGRIARVWGLEKSAKSGTLWNTVAAYQRQHCSECFQRSCKCKDRDVPEVVWVDAENRINDMLYWPKGHGVNLEALRVLCPPTGQNVVDFVDHIIRAQKIAKIGLIVVDSLAHIVSMVELNKPTLDGVTVGRNAALLNSAWRKWISAINSLGIKNARKPTILCINQVRQKVGVNFGSNETMPGGVGQAFATSVDIRFSGGASAYVVYDEKKAKWVAKKKGYGSTFKPARYTTPDFVNINFRVTASGIGPAGAIGEFNYWLKSVHGHRMGDPDNGLQLWERSKYNNMIKQEGGKKHLFGVEARTLDELKEAFRADKSAQKRAWKALLPGSFPSS